MMTQSNRRRGVQQPASQRAFAEAAEAAEDTHGEPGKLKAMSDVEWKAVWYYGPDGRLVADVVAIVGGRVYFAPNGQEWARRLTPATPQFQEQIFERIKAREQAVQESEEPIALPDTVAVMEVNDASPVG